MESTEKKNLTLLAHPEENFSPEKYLLLTSSEGRESKYFCARFKLESTCGWCVITSLSIYYISTKLFDKDLENKAVDHFFLADFTAVKKRSLKSLLVFWIVLKPSFKTSLVSLLIVCSLRFILASEGWGILYPTNSTSEWPERTVLNKFPKVWSSLLNT